MRIFSDGLLAMMSECEKMLAGLPHNPMDTQLDEARNRAKELLHDYNILTRPGDIAALRRLMGELLGKGGEGAFIVQPFYCDYGTYIEVGKNFFANFNCTILDAGGVFIGDNVLLAPNVGLYTVGHPLDAGLRKQAWEDAAPITIGDNVWIGAGVTIVGGVNIGADSVIAAGSVVTKDIPAGSLAMGVPCKAVRKITDADRAAYQARIDGAFVDLEK
ncbi:sugar O-acetyltransferase [Uruburuella testudinis]|uniref:Acetyltransferase n=1 Tax=Uruburuella testudinis TaxID=1282863 RepID=A0ABY4DVY0_9NEIS|nr:sugar O-acetyltransferase [Uruburuella testudinis]UOO82874.1 sugar O-acetyltransferase [Uruburuella testudinis]